MYLVVFEDGKANDEGVGGIQTLSKLDVVGSPSERSDLILIINNGRAGMDRLSHARTP